MSKCTLSVVNAAWPKPKQPRLEGRSTRSINNSSPSVSNTQDAFYRYALRFPFRKTHLIANSLLILFWIRIGNCLGRLRPDRRPESLHGRSSNPTGRLRLVKHCDRLVQTLWDGLSSQLATPAAGFVIDVIVTAIINLRQTARIVVVVPTAIPTTAPPPAKFSTQPRFQRMIDATSS